MKNYLFRGKSVENNEWAYGCLIYNSNFPDAAMIISMNGDMHKVIPKTVGLNTGIKAINGENIFEGDIVMLYSGKLENDNWKSVSTMPIWSARDYYVMEMLKNADVVEVVEDKHNLL